MISVKDIAWAAGFIEGEGCFSWHKTTPQVQVAQKGLEPLEKVRSIFGGEITHRKDSGVSYLQMTSIEAISCMMTIYPLMSPRRQAKIREILETWKRYKHANGIWSRWCRKRLHEMIPENTLTYPSRPTNKQCRACKAESRYREAA